MLRELAMRFPKCSLRCRWGLAVACLMGLIILGARANLRGGTPPQPLLPDLIVWESRPLGFLHGWTLDTTEQPGRVLLRFTTTTANQGAGPIELIGGETHPDGTQDVYQRVYYDNAGFQDVLAGVYVHHPEHNHIHFEDYAVYRLRRFIRGGGVGDVVASGEKISFCLLDFITYDRQLPGYPQFPVYSFCGTGKQGISVGWSDIYDKSLPDQWIDVTDVPSGVYWLEVEVDPSNRLMERDETNNVTRIRILLRK